MSTFFVHFGNAFSCGALGIDFYPKYAAALHLQYSHWRVLKFNDSIIRFFRESDYRSKYGNFFDENVPISMSITHVPTFQRIWPINSLPHSVLFSVSMCKEDSSVFIEFSHLVERFLLWSDPSFVNDVRLGKKFRVVPSYSRVDEGSFEISSRFFPERIFAIAVARTINDTGRELSDNLNLELLRILSMRVGREEEPIHRVLPPSAA